MRNLYRAGQSVANIRRLQRGQGRVKRLIFKTADDYYNHCKRYHDRVQLRLALVDNPDTNRKKFKRAVDLLQSQNNGVRPMMLK